VFEAGAGSLGLKFPSSTPKLHPFQIHTNNHRSLGLKFQASAPKANNLFCKHLWKGPASWQMKSPLHRSPFLGLTPEPLPARKLADEKPPAPKANSLFRKHNPTAGCLKFQAHAPNDNYKKRPLGCLNLGLEEVC